MVNNLPPLAGPVDASGEPRIDDGNIYIFCDTVRTGGSESLACIRGAGHNGDHLFSRLVPLMPVKFAAAVPSPPAQEEGDERDTLEMWRTAALEKDRTRRAIRERITAGENQMDIADDFKVPLAFISHLAQWQLFGYDEPMPPSSPVADSPTDYRAACEVLPDSLGRPLAARIQLVLDNLRRESHIGCELRRELDGGIERDAKAVEERWPEAAAYLRSHTHIEDGA